MLIGCQFGRLPAAASGQREEEKRSALGGYRVHAKPVGRIDYDALEELAGGGATLDAWLISRKFLQEDATYDAVPVCGADGCPTARYEQHWIDLLEKYGVIKQTTKEEVRGHVNMFVVLEKLKNRVRSIKHTVSINEILGRNTLRRCRFPGKIEIAEAIQHGEYFIELDFAAYYDQFPLARDVGGRMCFKRFGKWYRLDTLPMGQRHAVEIAQSATDRLLDFKKKSNRCLSIIDNVIFFGSKQDVIDDAYEFILRCRAVGATINDVDVPTATRDTMERRATTSGVWAGVDIDLTAKTTRVAQKTVDKLRVSWERRADWSWRDYAAHLGLLLWPWHIIDLPMPEFFEVLRFNSGIAQKIHAYQPPQRPDGKWPKNPAWNAAATGIPEKCWQSLRWWTDIVLDNRPRVVRAKKTTPDLVLECDASSWGLGVVCYNTRTKELSYYQEKWSWRDHNISHFNRATGESKLFRSTYAEPLALLRAKSWALRTNPEARRIIIGSDNTPSVYSSRRGFNSRSYHMNHNIKLSDRDFPRHEYDVEYLHVAGDVILADGLSRGRPAAEMIWDDSTIDKLRVHLGNGYLSETDPLSW
jgi:hypothetical protein